MAPQGAPAHTVTTRLDTAGESRMHSIDRWAQENVAVEAASLPYWNVDGSVTALNPAEASSLASRSLAVGVRAFTLATQVAAAIQASPPTVTTYADVDAAFAGFDLSAA